MSSRAVFKSSTIIQTPRLQIRPINLDDAEVFWDIRSYYEIYKWTMAGQWKDKQQAHDWIQTALDSEDQCNFVIELLPKDEIARTEGVASPEPGMTASPPEPPKSKPKIVGSIGLHRGTEIGYMFHPDYWGKGYATEALSAFLKKVWESLPEVQRVTGLTDSANEGSMGVLRKCGFKETGREDYENATMGMRMEVQFEVLRPGT